MCCMFPANPAPYQQPEPAGDPAAAVPGAPAGDREPGGQVDQSAAGLPDQEEGHGDHPLQAPPQPVCRHHQTAAADHRG